MNKSELITAISEKTGTTKKEAEVQLNALIETITETLVNGDKVQLVGFGSFAPVKRAARKGKNPQTGEEMKIPSKIAPVFKAGASLREAIAKK